MRTPKQAIELKYAEIVERIPFPHVIWDLGRKQVLSKSDVERLEAAEESGEELLEIVMVRDLDFFIAFCQAVEDAHQTIREGCKAVAFNLRRALDPENFGWQWMEGETVLEESHHQFHTELGCSLDGQRSKSMLKTGNPEKMKLIAYTSYDKLIGTVREAREVSRQTIGKRPSPPPDHHQPPPPMKRQKHEDAEGGVYTTRFSQSLDGDVIMEALEKDGQISIDVRRWYKRSSDGELQPSRKGIRLSLERFVRLMWLQEQVSVIMDDIKAGERVDKSLIVGGAVRLQMSAPFWTVHIREYYRKSDEVFPGRNGIVLKYGQWFKLLHLSQADGHLESAVPEIKNVRPCYTHDDHQNVEGALACGECGFFTDAEEGKLN